jgi:mediator of RNA polymerase II transcription subunit 31
MAYLRYLEYWREPEYARFIIYPACLQALTLILNNPTHAGKVLKDPVFCEHLLFQQRCAWQD